MKKAIIVLACLSVFYCSTGQRDIDKTTEDGVEVVLNHLAPYTIKGEPAILSLEREFSIDLEDKSLTEAGLVGIETFAIDREGNIFILQWTGKPHFVFKFDPKGKLLKSFLRQGQGPGELEYADTLFVTPRGEIILKDPSKPKFPVYDRDGNFVREVRLDKNYNPTPLLNGKYLIFWGEDTPEVRKQFVGVCDADFKNIKQLDSLQYPNGLHVKSPVNRHRLVFGAARDRIIIGNTERGYEFRIFDLEGNLRRKIRKDYRPVEVPEEVKKAYFDRWPKDDPIAANFYFTATWPAFRSFFTDDEGKLYVLTCETGSNPGEFMWDIFSPRGAFIGRISLSNNKNLASLLSFSVRSRQNRLISVREKEDGFQELVVYRTAWK